MSYINHDNDYIVYDEWGAYRVRVTQVRRRWVARVERTSSVIYPRWSSYDTVYGKFWASFRHKHQADEAGRKWLEDRENRKNRVDEGVIKR